MLLSRVKLVLSGCACLAADLAADSAETREAYRLQTEKAKAMGIFGAPTFVAGTEIFWGDDRLEEALAWNG